MVSGRMFSSAVRRGTRSTAVATDEAASISFSPAFEAPHSSPSLYFSIDVECVAIGTQHDARAVGQISLVDEHERVILNLYVQPDVPVVSYLTPLTGLTRDTLQNYGMPLAMALDVLRRQLPSSAILVGQNIRQDVSWLDLEEGVDFHSMMDLMGLYKIWNGRFGSWTVFSLEHLSNVILGMPRNGQPHNAVDDAIKSMRLFNFYRHYGHNQEIWGMSQRALLKTEPAASFARLHPQFEGVCMGNRKRCTCGAPFLG